MDSWPTIGAPLQGSDEETMLEPVATDPFPGTNAFAVRARSGTTVRRKWRLVWTRMPEADYQLLLTFYENHAAEPFEMPDPQDAAATVEAWFVADTLEAVAATYGYRHVNVTVEEWTGPDT